MRVKLENWRFKKFPTKCKCLPEVLCHRQDKQTFEAQFDGFTVGDLRDRILSIDIPWTHRAFYIKYKDVILNDENLLADGLTLEIQFITET